MAGFTLYKQKQKPRKIKGFDFTRSCFGSALILSIYSRNFRNHKLLVLATILERLGGLR